MNRVVFPQKQLTAEEEYCFDFISLLQEGETLSAAVVDVDVFSGADADPDAILTDEPRLDGTRVWQEIGGGTLGVVYTVLCLATTCNGQIISLAAFLSIVKDATQ